MERSLCETATCEPTQQSPPNDNVQLKTSLKLCTVADVGWNQWQPGESGRQARTNIGLDYQTN